MSDQRIERLETKIDQVLEQQTEMTVTLAKQHEQIAYHIRRTDLLEQQFKPVIKHVALVEGVGKLVGFGAAIAGIFRLFKK